MKITNLIALAGLFILITSATFSNKKENTETTLIADTSKESFIEFLSHFEKKEMPYSLGLNELYKNAALPSQRPQPAKLNKRKRMTSPIQNSDFIPEARFGGMSRMGPPELIPVARFYPNEKMIAVVYSSQMRFGAGLHKSYMLQLYDLKGNIISPNKEASFDSAHLIALSSVDESMTCTIDKKGRIWKNTYKNIWKEDVNEKGIVGNGITGHEIESTEVFELKEDGALVQLKEIPTTAKASLH